jgi:hypothetical protein
VLINFAHLKIPMVVYDLAKVKWLKGLDKSQRQPWPGFQVSAEWARQIFSQGIVRLGDLHSDNSSLCHTVTHSFCQKNIAMV